MNPLNILLEQEQAPVPTPHHWALDKDGDFTLQRRLIPVERLESGVYLLQFAIPIGLFLTPKGQGFKLPEPLYGCEETFIERVIRTYKHGLSFAAMLTGTKGTGKTVTCQKIANSLDQPCIIVPANFPGLVNFLACIPQPVTVFIDEYEKLFKGENKENPDSSLLPLLDGPMKGAVQRLVLLTSNDLSINENMIQRPGRIRYVQKFGNLPIDTIREVVVDRIVDRLKIEATVSFICTLQTITLDIVTALVDEVNIHGDEPSIYAEFFNVEQLVVSYDVYEHFRDQEFPKCVKLGTKVSPDWDYMDLGDNLRIGRKCLGTVISKSDEDQTVIVEDVAKDDKGEPVRRNEGSESSDNIYVDSDYVACIRKFELRPVMRKNYGAKTNWDL